MTIDNATDVGPATPPPAWCQPGTEGQWDRLVEDYGGGITCRWARYFPPDEMTADVWIECEDRIEDGRVLRSPPRIGYTEPSRNGLDAAGARRLAAELLNAANILDEHGLTDH
ncbi:MAG: hypothetical protein ACLP5J_08980 [Mycobacterium sp.]|uniref:hypothetical protein n=1 Tax=Mycobacterium sp. TaxID=1785 RepID=UPI003F95DB9D